MSTTDRSGVSAEAPRRVGAAGVSAGAVTVVVSTSSGSSSLSAHQESNRSAPTGRRWRCAIEVGDTGDQPDPSAGGPAAVDLGQDRVGGAGGLVAAEHPTEEVTLLLDDAHPHAEDPLAERRHAVHPALVAGRRHLGPRLHQPVLLELRQRSVDGRPVDPPEVQLPQVLLEAVAVARRLRQRAGAQREGRTAGAGRARTATSRLVAVRDQSSTRPPPRPGPYDTLRGRAISAKHTDLQPVGVGLGNCRCARSEDSSRRSSGACRPPSS